MKLMPIINHLSDTDLYKINMMRIYFYRFSDVTGEFEFKCRDEGVRFTEEMVEEIRDQVDHLCSLRFTPEEIEFLRGQRYHKDAVGFFEFLRFFQLNRKFIEVSHIGDCGLVIRAVGPLWAISPFEIYVLAIVNEVYFKFQYADIYAELTESFRVKLEEKVEKYKEDPFSLTEFGTRRRLSYFSQQLVISKLKGERGFWGTSNVHFAMKFKTRVMGTFAHEYVCMPQGLNDSSLSNSQRYAWDQWCREYRGDLGICLTDTLGQKKFEKDFDRYWANMFTGLRHDSGDPIEWADRAIKIYESMDIDPRTKTLMFSDSLNFDTCWVLEKYLVGRVKTAYGVGTYLTNDTMVKPLNIVIKLVRVNKKPVAKLSNVSGKEMGSLEHVKILKSEIES